MLLAGTALYLLTPLDFDLAFGAAGLAAYAQKMTGHVLAWRRGGVERAYVTESSAISFYVLFAAVAAGALIQEAWHLDVRLWWFAFGALEIDTIVRSVRESRYA